MKAIILAVVIMAAVTGCTTPATRLAIQDYRKSMMFNELAYNNSTRVAKEQMLLSLCEYIKLNPQDATSAVKATWAAREELETGRVQFLNAQSLSRLTVGQYLYDQQGILNMWFGHTSDLAQDAVDASKAADSAVGVNSVIDLIPKADSTTRPSDSSPFQEILNDILKKK